MRTKPAPDLIHGGHPIVASDDQPDEASEIRQIYCWRVVGTDAVTCFALPIPPSEVESMFMFIFDQGKLTETVIVVPAARPEMLVGLVVTVYPMFCKLAFVIAVATAV